MSGKRARSPIVIDDDTPPRIIEEAVYDVSWTIDKLLEDRKKEKELIKKKEQEHAIWLVKHEEEEKERKKQLDDLKEFLAKLRRYNDMSKRK